LLGAASQQHIAANAAIESTIRVMASTLCSLNTEHLLLFDAGIAALRKINAARRDLLVETRQWAMDKVAAI
jgi:hypothetical protein